MCRKLICLVSLAFVLSAVWTSPAEAADANLMGWWKLDGDGLDASGNGRNGTLAGDAHFEAGYLGQALALDGDGDYFTVDGYLGVFSASPVSVTAWVKTTETGDLGDIAYWGRNAGRRRVDFRINAGRLRVEHGSGSLQGDTSLNDGEWHHVALTMPALAPISHPPVSLWLDGQDDSRNTEDPDFFELVDNAGNVDLTFGRRVPQSDRYFNGMIDEVRMYDRELTGAEIRDIMVLGYLASPHSPSPADGEKIEDTWGSIAWTPGPLATSHNLYFSTSFDDVNAGAETAFVGNIATNSQPLGLPGFPAPDGLVPGTTYYWRVDEVSDTHADSPWRGDVWSFWIPPVTAYDPVPPDGEPAEHTDADLMWSLGLRGIMHAVYFGTDADQVANAVGAAPHVETTYDPGPLANSTTYYWRVDTFNGAEWVKGPVWSFGTKPAITITDPNLVCWWKLDESGSYNVLDWSGHGHDTTLSGEPQWVDGYDGSALKFDGADDYVLHALPAAQNFDNFTVTLWAKAAVLGQGEYVSLFSSHTPNSSGFQIDVDGTYPGNYRTNTAEPPGPPFGLVTTGWIHLAIVGEGTTVQYYYNGTRTTSYTYSTDELLFNEFIIGTSRNIQNYFDGTIDDFRVYDKTLTQEEIELVMRIDPLLAWAPSPTDGSTPEIDVATPLSWSRGDSASQHDVYFGVDADAIAIADASDATGIYRGRQSSTVYTPAEGIEWGGGPYYWRIDENNTDGTITRGKVWSFTVTDYLVVESFEDYNDYPPDEIWQTWKDGVGTTTNGATSGYLTPDFLAGEHYAETVNVHSGRQALPLFYNNNFMFSEATRTFASARDWTRHGVEELSLWYLGDPCNVSERMYVAVTGGATAVVYNDDPNLVTDTWTEWVIPLQTLAGQGVNLKSVTGIALGFGTRGNTTTPGGSGVVFFDDIRLRRTPVIPVVAAPLDAFDPTSAAVIPDQ